jgi:hypothetical protein
MEPDTPTPAISLISWADDVISFDLVSHGEEVYLVGTDLTGEVPDPRIVCTFKCAPSEISGLIGLLLVFQSIMPTSADEDFAEQVIETVAALYGQTATVEADGDA